MNTGWLVLPVDGLLQVAVNVAGGVVSEAESEVCDENDGDQQCARWNQWGAGQLTRWSHDADRPGRLPQPRRDVMW